MQLFMRTIPNLYTLSILFTLLYMSASGQFSQDSLLLAKSEKWEVKKNKGLFGLSKPEFGPYTTNDVVKLDSPVIKTKIKDSSYISWEGSSSGNDFDQSKYLTIKKSKFYKLSLGTSSVTTEAVFAIASVSTEKRQTLFGKLISKSDEGKDEVLNYNRNVPGIIIIENDSMHWRFLLENFTSGGQATALTPYPVASISGGYLKNENDSLAMQIYSSFNADIVLIDPNGEHLAALAFKQKKPEICIRNDISESYQHAIAAFFAVIISIKDY